MSRFKEEIIFEYLDDTCSSAVKQQIEEELATNDMFRARFEQLQSAHQGMLSLSLERPPAQLTDKVMQKLQALPQPGYSGYSGIFSGTGFLLVTGILTALVAFISMFNSGLFSVQSLDSAAQGYKLMEEWSYLKGILSERTLTNLMLVIYGALSIALLDGIVLNAIFRKKNKQLTL